MRKVARGLTFCVALLLVACGGADGGEGEGKVDSGGGGSRTINGIVVEAGATKRFSAIILSG